MERKDKTQAPAKQARPSTSGTDKSAEKKDQGTKSSTAEKKETGTASKTAAKKDTGTASTTQRKESGTAEKKSSTAKK